jgi:hypothetical protein
VRVRAFGVEHLSNQAQELRGVAGLFEQDGAVFQQVVDFDVGD